MRNLIIWPLIVAALMLSGCAMLESQQDKAAGTTDVQLTGCDQDQGVEGQYYCDVSILDGKEKQDVTVHVVKNMETGNVEMTYSATGVKAFEGQALRAEVDKAVTEAMQAVLPEMTQAIIEGVTGVP